MLRLSGLCFLTLVMLIAGGCTASSKSDTGASQLASVEGNESPAGELGGIPGPGEEGGESGEGSVFPEETKEEIEAKLVASVVTIVDPSQIQAGYEAQVICGAQNAAGDVLDADTAFLVLNTEELFFTTSTTVSFEKVGLYEVACSTADGTIVDETSAFVEVVAGDPTVLDTVLDKNVMTAGEKVTATCVAHDAFGNLNEWAKTELFISPGDNWVGQGNTAKVVGAGIFDAACMAVSTGAMDDTPEVLEVLPGIPRRIQTLLAPYAIEAGQSSQLTCRVLDYWNNEISGFPISIFKPQEVTLTGTVLSTVVAGLHPVKCVPATDEWELFDVDGATLQVLPGPPAEIYVEQIPPKPVYQKLDTLDLIISVLDSYANVIPDSPLKPLTVEPEAGIQGLGPATFKFTDDGVYTIGIVSDVDPSVSEQLEILVDGSGPAVVIETPARGATLNGKPAVTVEGVVQDDVAGVFSLELNGQDVDVKPDGSFSHIILANHGMNILRLSATDLGGIITQTTRAFYFSTEWYEADAEDLSVGEISNSFQVWLGQEFLDDGDHSAPPDDVATLVEGMMSDFLIEDALQNPVAETGPYKVFVSNIKLGATTVGLDSFDGGVAMDVLIPNFSMDLDLKGSCKILFVDICPDFSGDVSMNSIDISADVLATMEGSDPVFSVSSVNVSISGLDLDINGILGWLFDFLIDFILGFFVDDLEEAFEDALSDQIADLFEDLVSTFAFNTVLELDPLLGEGEGVNVGLDTNLGTVVFTDAGGIIGLDANASSQKVVAQKPLGSIGRAACLTQGEPPFEPEEGSSFGIGLHDDVFNRILFSMWWGGLFNLSGTLDELTGSDEADFLPGLQGVNIKTVFFAAPIVTSCNPAQTIKLQIADMFVDVVLALEGGLELQLGLFASVEAEADFHMIEDADTGQKELSLQVYGITDSAFEIVSITPGWESAKAEFEILIADALLDGLLEGLVGESLTSFPIPSVDLGSLDPSLEQEQSLTLTVQDLLRQYGYSVIYGELK